MCDEEPLIGADCNPDCGARIALHCQECHSERHSVREGTIRFGEGDSDVVSTTFDASTRMIIGAGTSVFITYSTFADDAHVDMDGGQLTLTSCLLDNYVPITVVGGGHMTLNSLAMPDRTFSGLGLRDDNSAIYFNNVETGTMVIERGYVAIPGANGGTLVQYPRNFLQEQCNGVGCCIGDCMPDRECCSRTCNLCN